MSMDLGRCRAFFLPIERLGVGGGRSLRRFAALVGGLALMAALVGLDSRMGQLKTVSVAKPAHVSQTWEQRKSAFGWRVHEAFGIHLDRAQEFAGWILEAADRQRLAPELIASLVFTESSFRKQVRSPAGRSARRRSSPATGRISAVCATCAIPSRTSTAVPRCSPTSRGAVAAWSAPWPATTLASMHGSAKLDCATFPESSATARSSTESKARSAAFGRRRGAPRVPQGGGPVESAGHNGVPMEVADALKLKVGLLAGCSGGL